MKITTKAQQVIKCLDKALVEVNEAAAVMCDADISTSMWAEINMIQNNLRAVLQVLEANENDK